jgi:chlorite dismutase
MAESGIDPLAATGRPAEQIYIQALALGLESAWRRLPADERAADAAAFVDAIVRSDAHAVRSHTYSLISLKAGADLLLWRNGPSVEALETSAGELLSAGIGRWMSVRHSLLGRIGESQYVRAPTAQEQSLFEGERSRYLIVYPFTKTADWYLLGREARQGIMNEHMRVGHGYPQVRQMLGYSFGIDDHDFLVAYETDDLVAFGDLVRALRSTESRRSTVRDTPILLGIHRPLEAILGLLGA